MKREHAILALGAAIALSAWVFVQGFVLGSTLSEETIPKTALTKSYVVEEEWVGATRRTPCFEGQSREESELCAQWRAVEVSEESVRWAQLSFWLSLIGTVGVVAALLLNWAANKFARISADREQRAYVGVDEAKMMLEVGESWKASVRMMNRGQTPALKVRVSLNLFIGKDDRKDFSVNIRDGSSSGVLGPGDARTVSINLERLIWTDGHEERLRDGRLKAYVFGRILYEDVTGAVRETSFRMRNRKGPEPKRLINASEGNEMN